MPPYTTFPRSARNLGRGCSLVKPAIQRRDAQRRASTTLHRPPQGEHPSSGGRQGEGIVAIYPQMSEVHSLRGGLIDIITQEILAQVHDTSTGLPRYNHITLTACRKAGK